MANIPPTFDSGQSIIPSFYDDSDGSSSGGGSSSSVLNTWGLRSLDINSLVFGDPSDPSWQRLDNTGVNQCTARYAAASDGTYQRLVEINPDRDAVGLGRIGYGFHMPEDATGCRLVVPIQARSDMPGGAKLRFVILDSTATVIDSIVVIPGNTLTTQSWTPAGLVAGTRYYLTFELNNSPTTTNQMVVQVGRVQLTPLGAAGLFAINFVRIPIHPRTILRNVQNGATTEGYDQSSLSEIEIVKSQGAEVRCEIEMQISAAGNDDKTSIYIDDEPLKAVNGSGTTGNISQQVVTVPQASCVLKWSRGVTANSTPGSGNPTLIGQYPRAIYAPQGSTIRPKHASERRMLIYGDSISVGAGGTIIPGIQSYLAMLRRQYPGDVISEGWSGRSLVEDASTAVKRAVLVEKILRERPTDILITIGTNDYGLNTTSAATFGSIYGPLLDDLRYNVSRIWCLTPIRRIAPASEAANGSGSTLDDYRTQITNQVSVRSWTTLIDGKAIFGSGDTLHYASDGIHPNASGHNVMLRTLLTAFKTATTVASSVPSTNFLKWSGEIDGDAGPGEKKRFMADETSALGDGGSANPVAYLFTGPGGSARVVRNIAINVTLNTMTSNHAIAVYKNGVEQATLLQVVTPGTTGTFILANSLSFTSQTDTIDIGIRGTAGGVGNKLVFSVVIEIS